QDEPKVNVEIPPPPELLKGEALKEWQRLTPMLADAGVITKLDRNMVAAYCHAWARWVECEKFLEKTGLIVMSPNKMPIYSPYLSAANKAMEQMRQLSEQLGLSPSARSRIRVTQPIGPEDAAETFLGR